jgi:transposase-like protein
MPRIEKPAPKCLHCQKTIQTAFYSIRFDTREGWCTEDCFYKWSDADAERAKRAKEAKSIDAVVYNPRAQ